METYPRRERRKLLAYLNQRCEILEDLSTSRAQYSTFGRSPLRIVLSVADGFDACCPFDRCPQMFSVHCKIFQPCIP